MKVAYFVSRFPKLSETFIVRELNALADCDGFELELFSLFPARRRDPVHRAAAPWTGRLHRVGAGRAARDFVWWLTRRPLRTLTSVLVVVAGTARRPTVALRALATLPIAASHARTISRLRIDHVHAHFASHPALAAWFAHRLSGTPYSVTAHAYDLFVHQTFLGRKLRDARFVVAISDYNRRFLVPHAGTTPIHLIHCGIDPSAYPFRFRRPPPAGPVRAVCVASLEPYKGHSVLLAALAEEPRLDRLELDLIGDGPLRAALERRAGELGLSRRVRFRGSLAEHDVTRLLDEADLFVLPSVVAPDGLMEGLPVALVEAVACGLPVVSTRLSGIPEVVRTEAIGLLAEPGDVESLRSALVRTLDDPPDRHTDPAAGRRLVEAEFDVRRSARHLAGVLGAAHEARH